MRLSVYVAQPPGAPIVGKLFALVPSAQLVSALMSGDFQGEATAQIRTHLEDVSITCCDSVRISRRASPEMYIIHTSHE